MKKMKRILLIILILALTSITVVSGYSMTRDIGESYVSWTWDKNVTVNVMIDGVNIIENSTAGYYYLTGINCNEEHRIDIYNGSNPSERRTDIARTLPSSGLIYMLLGIAFLIILIILYFIINGQEFYSIFFAIMGGVLANYARGLCYKNWGLEGVFFAIIIVYIILGVIAIYSLYNGKNNYDML